MPNRKPITQATVEGMAAELAGLPLAPGRAKLHAEVLEGLVAEIARLRELPLNEFEPAFVYRPVEPKPRGRK
jgi:hypothetical protein